MYRHGLPRHHYRRLRFRNIGERRAREGLPLVWPAGDRRPAHATSFPSTKKNIVGRWYQTSASAVPPASIANVVGFRGGYVDSAEVALLRNLAVSAVGWPSRSKLPVDVAGDTARPDSPDVARRVERQTAGGWKPVANTTSPAAPPHPSSSQRNELSANVAGEQPVGRRSPSGRWCHGK